MNIALPFCQLTRFIFTTTLDFVRETHDSFPSLQQRLRELCAEHFAIRPKVGMSVVLENSKGSRMQVGISSSGWLLILNPGKGSRVLKRSDDAKRYVSFLLPDWTDINEGWLRPAEEAKEIIGSWLENGDVDELPGETFETDASQLRRTLGDNHNRLEARFAGAREDFADVKTTADPSIDRTKTTEALVHWRSQAEGGRAFPPSGPHYSAPIRFVDSTNALSKEAWTVLIQLKEKHDEFTWIASLNFLMGTALPHLLSPGTQFALFEGAKCVARGRILKD